MKVRVGNVFDNVTSGVIIHGCNAQGVMGSGVAKEVKERYPGAFNLYRQHCEKYGIGNKDLLGDIPAWTNCTAEDYAVDAKKNLIIINAITQLNYGRDEGKRYMSYYALQVAMDNAYAMCKAIGADEVNFPMIGAGLGGGDWAVISAIISDSMKDIKQTLWVLD